MALNLLCGYFALVMKKEKHMPRMPNTLMKGKEKNTALARRLQKSREGTISRGRYSHATEKTGKTRSEKHPINSCGNVELLDEFLKKHFQLSSSIEIRSELL